MPSKASTDHPIHQVIEANEDPGKLTVVNHCETHDRTSVHVVPRTPKYPTEFWPTEGREQTYNVSDEWCRAHYR